MAKIVFYEKLGCQGNARQKKILRESGHELDVRNLLTEAWTQETLLPFFTGLSVFEWFNQNAPDIKSGKINPNSQSKESALALMLAMPILIRRPLMAFGDRKVVGFDLDLIHEWLGVKPSLMGGQDGDLEVCQSTVISCDDKNG